MAVVTFGVVASDVASSLAYVGDIDASSEPTATRLTNVINQRAADLCTAFEAAGVNPSNIPTDSALYASCAGHIIRMAGVDWFASNQAEETDFTTTGREEFAAFLAGIRSGALSYFGTESAPASNVSGAFNRRTIVTATPSRAPRLGFWRKGRGFN